MRRNSSKRRKVAVTFMAMLLVITLIAMLLPKATAAPTITSIDPESGHVGDIVRVVGEIDTVNGSFTIFFDGEEVKNGTAVGTTVNDTFIVLHRPLGNYSVMLQDATTKINYTFPTSFAVETAYYVKAVAPQLPQQLQEGEPTQILVNVTGGETNTVYSANITVPDPSGAVYYNDTLQLTNTTNTGHGEGNLTYPANFSLGANTDYVGVYTIAFNGTLATGNFTVGLTDRLEYGRTETGTIVGIQGAGYGTEKLVQVNITFARALVAHTLTLSDHDGAVPFFWEIPKNAQLGTYTLILANETGFQIKPVPDIQNFTVSEIIVHCETQNIYDGNPLADVAVDAYLIPELIDSGKTNKTGFVDLRLDLGNYTFKAFWKGEEVGSLENQSVTGNATLSPIKCALASITITVKDEACLPLPFINLTLASDKTGVLQFETNNTGTVRTNTFTNVSYTIEAWRYGHLFNTTQIANLTVTEWINITCPILTLFVNVLDSKEILLRNVEINVYEWSSGVADPLQSQTTDDLGNAVFHLTFGRYRIWVCNDDHTIVLNKTVVDLTEDHMFLVIHCKIFNVDLSVIVKDYFGQPISNALVEVKRENETMSQKTGSKGTYSFYNITGGDCQISVTIMEKVSETRTLYLDEAKVVVFKLGKFAVVGGFLLEVTQLIAYVSLGIVIILFVLALIYRRLRLRKGPEEEKEKSL